MESFYTVSALDAGADGGSRAVSYSLTVETPAGGTGLATSDGTLITLEQDGDVVYGVVAGSTKNTPAFTLALVDGQLTLTQYAALANPTDQAYSGEFIEDPLALLSGNIFLNVSVTDTDQDGDTSVATAKIDLGDNLVFEDDGPELTSGQDAKHTFDFLSPQSDHQDSEDDHCSTDSVEAQSSASTDEHGDRSGDDESDTSNQDHEDESDTSNHDHEDESDTSNHDHESADPEAQTLDLASWHVGADHTPTFSISGLTSGWTANFATSSDANFNLYYQGTLIVNVDLDSRAGSNDVVTVYAESQSVDLVDSAGDRPTSRIDSFSFTLPQASIKCTVDGLRGASFDEGSSSGPFVSGGTNADVNASAHGWGVDNQNTDCGEAIQYTFASTEAGQPGGVNGFSFTIEQVAGNGNNLLGNVIIQALFTDGTTGYVQVDQIAHVNGNEQASFSLDMAGVFSSDSDSGTAYTAAPILWTFAGGTPPQSDALITQVTILNANDPGNNNQGVRFDISNPSVLIGPPALSVAFDLNLADSDADTASTHFSFAFQAQTESPGCSEGKDQSSHFEDPVVLDLHGDGIHYLPVSSGVLYDYGAGLVHTAWTAPEDGILVFQDLYGVRDDVADGVVIVNFTSLNSSAQTDLQAVRLEFDDNHTVGADGAPSVGDGVLDHNDSLWTSFSLWQDSNSDGQVDVGELRSLDEHGITSIGLTTDGHPATYADGDVLVHGTGSYTYLSPDGQELTADLHDASFATSPLTHADVQPLDAHFSVAEVSLATALDSVIADPSLLQLTPDPSADLQHTADATQLTSDLTGVVDAFLISEPVTDVHLSAYTQDVSLTSDPTVHDSGSTTLDPAVHVDTTTADVLADPAHDTTVYDSTVHDPVVIDTVTTTYDHIV